MTVRFTTIFICSLFVFFGILNIRFIAASVRYWLAPGTIISSDSLSQAKAFPLAQDVFTRPLPSNARLVIDSLGVNAPIVFDVPPDNDIIYKNLERGVVHYSNSVKPGQPGAAVVLGHSSAYPWYKGKYGSVFALISKLKPGDKFYVQYEDGRLFVYSVRQSIIFNPFKPDGRLSQLETTDRSSIVLVSCYPVGTNYLRIAVQADVVES
ncbi:MAG: sortase [Patescibacteria group bacterium]